MDRSKTSQSSNAGLTLIGVLVSVLLLASAVLIASGVALRSQQAAALSREKLIAANLAREGLELVRYVRDTNQFAIVNNGEGDAMEHGWVQDLCNSSDAESFTVESQADLSVLIGDIAQPQLYLDEQGFYTHTASAADATPSPFNRSVTIDCTQAQIDEADYATNEAFVEVTAQVDWNYRDQPQTVVLKERLYDWYR